MAVRAIMKSLEMEGFNNEAIQEFCFAYLATVAQDNQCKLCEDVLCSIEVEFNRFKGVSND